MPAQVRVSRVPPLIRVGGVPTLVRLGFRSALVGAFRVPPVIPAEIVGTGCFRLTVRLGRPACPAGIVSLFRF